MILKIETNFLIKIIKEMPCKKFPNTLNQNSLHKNLKASPNNYATPRPKNVKSVPKSIKLSDWARFLKI